MTSDVPVEKWRFNRLDDLSRQLISKEFLDSLGLTYGDVVEYATRRSTYLRTAYYISHDAARIKMASYAKVEMNPAINPRYAKKEARGRKTEIDIEKLAYFRLLEQVPTKVEIDEFW